MEVNNIYEYLTETKKAVQDTFTLLKSYEEVITSIPSRLWLLSEDQLQNPSKEIRHRLKKENEYIRNIFSENIISGLLLQFAYVGIDLFSKGKEISNDYSELKEFKKIKKFFIGREINTIKNTGAFINKTKIGLIIYAGRNQWAHPLAKSLRRVNKVIFDRIAQRRGIYSKSEYVDPAFDLSEAKSKIFATNILDLLGWKNYEDYEKDMLGMEKDFKSL